MARFGEVEQAMREGRWARRAMWAPGTGVRLRPVQGGIRSVAIEWRIGGAAAPELRSLGDDHIFQDDWEIVPDEPLLLPAVDDTGAVDAVAQEYAFLHGDCRDKAWRECRPQAAQILRTLHDYAREKARA